MFEALKTAWREAVENFRRELDAENEIGESPTHPTTGTDMRQSLRTAERELERVEAEYSRTREEHRLEEAAAKRCARQETMAREIGDVETAEIAADFAIRHTERAAVFHQKLNALAAEAKLRRREIDEMRRRWARTTATPSDTSAGTADPTDLEFDQLERDAREEAAAQRLDELKRRMR